jgi:hypothetical protein
MKTIQIIKEYKVIFFMWDTICKKIFHKYYLVFRIKIIAFIWFVIIINIIVFYSTDF